MTETLQQELPNISQALFENLIESIAQIESSITVQNSASNMLLMNVEDILVFAQLKAGKFTKQIARFNIQESIKDVISLQQDQATAKRISVSTKFLGPDEDFVILSDEKRIKQIQLNI